jgi:hypothetical protein
MKPSFKLNNIARIYPHTLRWLRILSLEIQNRVSRRPITGECAAVVSLTTYGTRTNYVHLALETIAQGVVRPKRIILWLDESDVLNDLPTAIERLRRRGLEVRACRNYGPHKKYYPYLESSEEDQLIDPLVIIDDDFLYPATWLSSLLDSYHQYPEAVSCTRAHEFQLDDVPTPYAEWPPCNSDSPSPLTFATGVGGVLYPRAVQLAIKSRGTQFDKSAPRADDVWLHYVTVASGNAVRQISSEPLKLEFKILPFAQGASLQAENVGLAGNDRQISRTYDDEVLATLRLASYR